MKRFLLFILGVIISCNLYAQTQDKQELRFVYIAHDENTATDRLCERLQKMYYNALEFPENFAIIFYFAKGDEPIIIKVNTSGDNSRDFPLLIEALQNSRSTTPSASVDMEKILEIFNDDKVDILDDNGGFRYRSVDWYYYINKNFWIQRLNEKIIASLYWTFEMEKYINAKYLSLSIWYSKEDNLGYNKQYPFGKKNICSTMPFYPLQY